VGGQEPEHRFVQKRRGFHRLIPRLTREMTPCDGSQLASDLRQQSIQRVGLSARQLIKSAGCRISGAMTSTVSGTL
jgi:hypothetical protein